MDQGRPSERRGLAIAEPEHLGGVHAELCAPTAVAGHVRRFQVDEVRRHRERVVEFGAFQGAVRFRLQVEHGIPRLDLLEPAEPPASVRGEEIRKLRVVGAAAALTRGVECLGR